MFFCGKIVTVLYHVHRRCTGILVGLLDHLFCDLLSWWYVMFFVVKLSRFYRRRTNRTKTVRLVRGVFSVYWYR